jgi:hypothetical protein
MSRTVTIEIDDEQDAAAAKLRAAWPQYSEAGFWAAVLAHGLDYIAALQEGEAELDKPVDWKQAPPTTGDDIPF